MSIADKKVLMYDVEKRLGSVLTVDQMTVVLQNMSEVLNSFEVEMIANGQDNTQSEELLETFLHAKRLEGRSEKTLDRYKYVIRRIYDYAKTPVGKISVFHLRNYLTIEKERGISDSTLDGIRQVLSAYFGWLQKEGLIKNDPTLNLQPIKIAKKVRKPYSTVDIRKLEDGCTTDRDKAIISILLSTGCRISEVCSMNKEDVDLVSKEILVIGKGNKERTVFINDVTVMFLKRYLASRNDNYPALFVGKNTDRLHPGGIRKMLHIVADKVDVENAHPHRFRRALATSLINHGMPIQEVAVLLGHEKLDTTMKYFYSDKNNTKSSYNKYAV